MHLAVPDRCRKPNWRGRPRRSRSRRTGAQNVADRHTQQGDAIDVAQSGVVRGAHQLARGINEPTTGAGTTGNDDENAGRSEPIRPVSRTEPVEGVRFGRDEHEVVAVSIRTLGARPGSGFGLERAAPAVPVDRDDGRDNRVRLDAAAKSDDGPTRFAESGVRAVLELTATRCC